ncbi:MAG: hypothetical protein JNK15_19730 [Planctomycetes bacterium]|nr:hypothetical protein [Planctomycetota bacterium]
MKKLATAFLFAFLLLLSGCLEIDGQDITIRFDPEADRIDIHIVYRGLFAESGQGSDKDPLAKAVRDLEEAKQTGEFVFWCNWPLSVDLTREFAAPIAAVTAHLDVENGGLFTDPHGVLCAQQFVRIRDAKAFVKKLNLAFEVFAQTQLANGTPGFGGSHAWDGDTKELVREFLRSGEKLLVLEGGRLEVRLPVSAKDHAWIKGQLEQRFLRHSPEEIIERLGVAERRQGGGDVTNTSIPEESVQVAGTALRREMAQSPSFRFFWDNEITFVRELELTRIGFGVAGSNEITIKKATGGLYHDALLQKLRENKETIEDGLPDQELARRFDEFRKRDAKLPGKVAEIRAKGGKGAKPEKNTKDEVGK